MKFNDQIHEVIGRFQSSFYFYDLDQFESHIQAIKKTLHKDIRVWYATKANPMSEILRILVNNGFGIDVASMGELKQARSAGATRLIATGPAKTRAYLGSLMQAEVEAIVIESYNQLKDLNEIAGKLGRKQNVLLRVQLDWNEESKSVLGGSAITPFGLGIDDWRDINIHEFKNVNVQGLHCFQWGNILDIHQLENYWQQTIEACQRLSHDLKFEMKIIDLGGGLGLSYKDEQEIRFEDVHELLLKFKSKYELNEIWLELGRFSIGKFGSYFTRIVDVKSVRGKNIIVTEGGINHIARPALVNESFPCRAFEVTSTQQKAFAVHGPLCTSLDHLGDFELPETLKPGDWLEFKRAGAYGFTESMPYFLCHNLVGEAFVYKKELMVARSPETNLEWMV